MPEVIRENGSSSNSALNFGNRIIDFSTGITGLSISDVKERVQCFHQTPAFDISVHKEGSEDRRISCSGPDWWGLKFRRAVDQEVCSAAGRCPGILR